MKFPFQRYIVCWGKVYGSKIIVGGWGAPQATSAFYSVKLCIIYQKNINKIFQCFKVEVGFAGEDRSATNGK